MSTRLPVRRRAAQLFAACAATLIALSCVTGPAVGAPTPSPSNPPSAAAADPDGRVGSLQGNLEAAARDYLDAKAKLEYSQKRQVEITAELKIIEQDLAQLEVDVGAIAAAAYRGQRARLTTLVMLDGSSPDTLLHNTTTITYMVSRDDQKIHRLLSQRQSDADEKAALAAATEDQKVQVKAKAKAKDDAERALNYSDPTGGFKAGPATAEPSPRNPDGTWSPQSCTEKDPTTSGCLTTRTLHALEQARVAGFTRYTACWRAGTFAEHPLGRACDFAANANGFVDARASGTDKEYGDRLAAWFLSNADRLAVLYVIWYKQIWMASTGWRAYSGDGTASGDHYNHVHLSVY